MSATSYGREGAAPPVATATRRTIRTPRAAAIAGIVFSLLLTIAIVLIREAVPADPNDAGALISDSSRRKAVLLGLELVPFAGIAFLWFIGVIRDRIGAAEDRLFASVFLGSGLLFVGMLFVSAAIAGGLVASAAAEGRSLAQSGAWDFGRRMSVDLMTTYAMRMAAVFTIATSTILLRGGHLSRWFAVSGYALAAVQLVAVGHVPWIELLFPAWVLLLSIHILTATFREGRLAEAHTYPLP